MNVTSPDTGAAFADYYRFRWRMLRQPWGQPPGSERDDHESGALHRAVLNEDGVIIAVGRLHLESPRIARIRYMAVDSAWRGRGVGTLLLHDLEALARERQVCTVLLNAREAAVAFYQKQGYRQLGPGPLLFDCIAHTRMQKDLDVS